ncbi:MAG: hypothetical protein H7223_02645 [Pedobacter sp.]|nr:hypothetical protein [Pedobacter sp.]
MNESEIREIAYNCRKATFLIEKQQIASITLREKLELKIHLAGCSICKTFMQQSFLINKMVHQMAHSSNRSDLKLTLHFKEELQVMISDRLNRS